MSRRTLVFLALAVTMLYGVGFAVVDGHARSGYATIGAVVVALGWVAVGMLGRTRPRGR